MIMNQRNTRETKDRSSVFGDSEGLSLTGKPHIACDIDIIIFA